MTKRNVGDSELSAILRAEIAMADGQSSSELSAERAANMDYYQCRPFGNEVDGRSAVVSSDVRDTIEWILPTLIRIFCSGEDAVEFEPEAQADIPAARQATEYVNFIWNRDNRGFVNFYSWFKDALLQKNGVLKIWWDDTPRTKRERYSGLDDAAFTWLVANPDVEVAEHTEHVTQIELPQPDETGAPPSDNSGPQLAELVTHDVVITRTMAGGRVAIMPVPPEEFLISNDARDIANARFVGHRRRRTLSDLVEAGYDRAVVERLAGDEASIATDAEEIARNTVEDQFTPGSGINPAMRTVWVTEAYIRADVDGDGIAEMRKVVTAGAGCEILSNESWDSDRPFANLTPIIMPHRYHGLAVADLIRDVQLIKSTIMRQYLDNLYLANNQREQVIEANIVDPAEVLSAMPGRKIRVKNGPAVFPIQVPDIGAQALAGLDYIDQVAENRTGVSARTQGLAADQLHDTATGERMLMSAAMGKIELVARIFAETGVKDAFRLILKLVCMYQDKPRTIRLTRDQWATMDPSSWNSDMDMTVRVGMGMGDKDQQLQNALALGSLQQQALPLGYVTAENLRNSAEIVVNAMGLKGVDRFFSFPQGPAALQPAWMPNAGAAGAQAEMARTAAHIQNAQARTANHIQLAQGAAQAKSGIAAFKAQQEMALKAFQAQQEMALRRIEVQQDAALLKTPLTNGAALGQN